ncbi:MAG TPA: peptidylprolyl isomerase [Verrucomicrobiae bacterium]|nr:peptidylprolyl isomerase [Verrucomicrobiae bacterium]
MKANLKGVFVCCLAVAFGASAQTPVITSQPQSITINNASTANFSVVAQNAATYQWMFGSTAIPGATDSTLTLDDATNTQAGYYTVVVTSSTGDSTNSQPAQLSLVPGTIVQLTFSGYGTGGASNVVVQLFDHDKPATVQNFLHYINIEAYTNIFWSRLVPGFVLQGGDYATVTRTNSAPFSAYSVYNSYTTDLGFVPPFPFEIDNEYGVGPQINNTFGTIAMAKSAGNPDSAANTFFFNLADNSTNLDNQNGGFTVFGRILSGTNVLDYFNTFSASTVNDRVDYADTNGILNYGGALSDLPVNYHGIASPADSNLFYITFAFLTFPVIDTTPPTISLVYPANGATVTNADVIVAGTAADDTGLARVQASITGTNINAGEPLSGNANGTINWSFDSGNLAPGAYSLDIVSQDGAGNLSSHEGSDFVVPQFPFGTYANGPGKVSPSLTQANTKVGSKYVVRAIPSAGAIFVGWTFGTNLSFSPTYSFTMPNGGQLTANFVPNTLPGGISFTYPKANAKLTTNSVTLTGTIKPTAGVTTVSCQFFSKNTGDAVTGPMVTSSSGAWSIPAAQLSPGSYIVQAIATNSAGKTTAISEDFTVLTPLSITVSGPGKTSLTNGEYLVSGTSYSIKATPNPGDLFYAWTNGGGMSLNPSINFTMTNGVAFTAIFISNTLAKDISFTYPPANSKVTADHFMLTGNISASVVNPQVTCQIFSNGIPVNLAQVATINGTTWSVPVSLPQGTYTALAYAFDSSGRQTLASESFKVSFFANIAGTYYGIFFPTNIATDNSGYFKLTLNASGYLSGTLQFPLRSYTITYPVNPSGTTGWLAGEGFDGPYGPDVYFDVIFDLTNGTDTVTGYVYWDGTYANLTGYRGVTTLPTNTAAGKYILNFDTVTNLLGSGPTNDGYATLSVSKTGTMTIGGTLADNSTFSRTTGVSKDGIWPIYAPLYGGGGMILGWETNVIGTTPGSAGSVGTLVWIKPKIKGTYYTNALGILASSTGTNYITPVNGSQYQVVFEGGTINPSLDNILTVKAGQFVPAAGAPDKLKISLSAAGVITGTIYNPADKKTLPIRGSFINPSVGGSGFVLDTDGGADQFQILLAQ